MRADQRERVGSRGLEVTRMGMGGTTFGNMYAAVTPQLAAEIVAAGFTQGIRYFDTAPLYGFGLSESRLGAGLAALPRREVVISSKVGYTLVPRDPGEEIDMPFVDMPPLKTVFDYSRDGVLRSIEGSLERLQTDHLDIVLIHDPDEGISIRPDFDDPYAISHFAEVMDQVYPALDQMRDQGVVKAIGLGMNQWQMLADFAEAGDFDCFLLAGRYTLLEQESLRRLLPLCQERDVRIIIGGPYNSGILATGAVEGAYYNYGPAPDELMQRVAAIEAVCARHQVPLQAAALQFPFGHPAVATVIPGARSIEEVEANIAFLEAPIAADFWSELKAEGLIDAEAPEPGD